MLRIAFRGHILPVDPVVTLNVQPNLHFPGLRGGGVDVSIEIRNSIIHASCVVHRDDLPGEILRELRQKIYETAHLAVDQVSFLTGYGYVMHIDEFIDENGQSSPILLSTWELRQFCTAFSVDSQGKTSNFEAVYKLLLKEPQAALALNDLVACLARPDLAPINCARVIDALRKALVPGKTPKEAWPMFNQHLRLEESFIKPISLMSANPRHGGERILGEPRYAQLLAHTWIIMDRFLHYRLHGDTLPLGKFPTMKG